MTGYGIKYFFLTTFIFLAIFPTSVLADEAPQYSSSPSAAVTANATCTLSARGGGGYAPADVSFSAVSTVNGKKIDQFTYDFGDGTISTGSGSLSHRYGQAGIYSVTAQPLVDPDLVVNPCKMTITLKAFPFVSHKSECTGLTLITGSSWTPQETGKVRVVGYDNKGELTGYRIQTDGVLIEQSTGDFDVSIATPGAYVLKAFVKDTTGIWVGGDGLCSKDISIKAAGITRQPETGPGSVYWLSLFGLFAIWLGAELWYQQNRQVNG